VRQVYAFPFNANCQFAGLASVGGAPSSVWINGNTNTGILAHEFGHTLGLYHSHALNCHPTVVTAPCSVVEYGDGIDVMGAGGFGHYNARMREAWRLSRGFPRGGRRYFERLLWERDPRLRDVGTVAEVEHERLQPRRRQAEPQHRVIDDQQHRVRENGSGGLHHGGQSRGENTANDGRGATSRPPRSPAREIRVPLVGFP